MRISDWSSDVCSSDLPKGKMTRTWISVEDQPTAAWAGLWRPSDEWGDCYTGVMVYATEELFDIHDRMPVILHPDEHRSEEHTSELQSLMRTSYAVFCLKKKKNNTNTISYHRTIRKE